MLKKGVWGSGLDSLLGSLRAEIDRSGSEAFPVEGLEAVLAERGKALDFDETEIDALLRTEYGSPQSFLILSLLYPGLDFSKAYHEDHIYPRSRFSKTELRKAGVSEDQIDAYRDSFNKLPNLQLLPGAANTHKLAALPGDWVKSSYPDESARRQYLADNDLDDLPGIDHFLEFFERREDLLRGRLAEALGRDTRARKAGTRDSGPDQMS